MRMGAAPAARSQSHASWRHPRRPLRRTAVMDGAPPTGTVGLWRLLRGGVVGATATTLAVGGHILAAGRPPSWTVLATATIAIGGASILLSRLRWTLPRLLALLLAGQAGLHALFLV